MAKLICVFAGKFWRVYVNLIFVLLQCFIQVYASFLLTASSETVNGCIQAVRTQ